MAYEDTRDRLNEILAAAAARAREFQRAKEARRAEMKKRFELILELTTPACAPPEDHSAVTRRIFRLAAKHLCEAEDHKEELSQIADDLEIYARKLQNVWYVMCEMEDHDDVLPEGLNGVGADAHMAYEETGDEAPEDLSYRIPALNAA